MSAYEAYKAQCQGCTLCKEQGLLSTDPAARPLFMHWEPRRTDVLFVLQAPNAADTRIGHLTYGEECKDRTGKFFDELVTTHLKWETVPDVLVTNAVLCLPKKVGNGDDVPLRQRRTCACRCLQKLIDAFQPRVVCPLGGVALAALNDIHGHHWVLSINVGQAKPWCKKVPWVFPLYHCGGKALGTRKPEQQHEDWAKLRAFLDGLPPR
jgi:uracil-DNA glycosylase